MSAYSLGDVARMFRVSRRRLRYWERTALVPSHRRDSARTAFGFTDLHSVKSVVGLLECGIPLRRIRSSVEAARERLPELDGPLRAIELWEGSRRVVLRHDGCLMQPDGQLVLDFSGGAVASLPVIRFARRDAARASEATDAADPERAAAWFDRGCMLDADPARTGDAIKAYRNAIEADPACADAYCNLGALYVNRDRRGDARSCFERALEVQPGHIEANLNLAALLEEDGRDARALQHYRAALDRDPWLADAHVSVALLYERISLIRAANRHWRRYLQLEPTGIWAATARDRVVAH